MGLLKGKIQYDKSVNQQWNVLKSKNYYILLWNIIIITVNIPLFFSIIFLSFSFLLKRKGLKLWCKWRRGDKGSWFPQDSSFLPTETRVHQLGSFDHDTDAEISETENSLNGKGLHL